MSTVDLSALPPPQVLESLDFETVYQEELSVFRTYLGDNWNAELESDPVVKLLELGAYRRLQTRARINDAAKSLLLAYARGTDLDHLAANVRLLRLVIQQADTQSVPPVPQVMEQDDALRERIQLVYEGLTTAGPRNSYILHARNASALVADAQAQSPGPAQVVITVLHLEGKGIADQPLLDKVYTYLSDEDIRPVGDRLTVQSAEVLEYRIDAVLHMAGTGSENEAILTEATRRLAAWLNPRRRLGIVVTRSAIDAQLHITGISRVDLPGWQDIRCAPHQAAYCIGYNVSQGDAA